MWDPNDPNEDADSDELSDQIPEARRHSLTESETSKTSQERPMEVQSTKSLKQVTFSQAGVSDMLDRAHLDLELNRCAALASEASATIPPCDQSSRCLRAFVATEVDVDMKKGDLEDAVKRCTKIAELLNQKLREQALFSEDRHAATAELQNGLAEEGVQLAGHSQASAGPMDPQEARPHRDSGVEDDDVVQVRRRPNSFPPPRGKARSWQPRLLSDHRSRRGVTSDLPEAVEEELSPRAWSVGCRKPLRSWSVEDVYRWTLQVALCPLDVAERLRHQAVNGLVLASLTEQDLENMGVSKFGWRRQLVLLARCLREKAPQPGQVSPHMQQPWPMPQPTKAPTNLHPAIVLPNGHEQRKLPASPSFYMPVTRSTLPAQFKPWLANGGTQPFQPALQAIRHGVTCFQSGQCRMSSAVKP